MSSLPSKQGFFQATELQFSIDLEIGLKVDNCSYKSAWDRTLVTSDLFEHVPIAQNTD